MDQTKTAWMIIIFPVPLRTPLSFCWAKFIHIKFWTHHNSLSSSCLHQRVSVPSEQLHPLKICPIIWMQMQYFIGRTDTTQLLRSYSDFAMSVAFQKESCCSGGNSASRPKCLAKGFCFAWKIALLGTHPEESQSRMKRCIQASVLQCRFSQNKSETTSIPAKVRALKLWAIITLQ